MTTFTYLVDAAAEWLSSASLPAAIAAGAAVGVLAGLVVAILLEVARAAFRFFVPRRGHVVSSEELQQLLASPGQSYGARKSAAKQIGEQS